MSRKLAFDIKTPRTQECLLGNYPISVRRLDELDEGYGGNKWYKLRYNIERAIREGYDSLLSFGGDWSNHLHALAHSGKELGVQTIGIVRGEPERPLSATLRDAQLLGMRLHFVTRSAYREKDSPEFLTLLREQFGRTYIIPEGGANYLGVNGCMEICTPEDSKSYDLICIACGTGTTMAGILLGTKGEISVRGFSVLRASGMMEQLVKKRLHEFLGNEDALLELMRHAQFDERWHFGGYARWNEELLSFMSDVEPGLGFALDQVYMGKLLFGVWKSFESGEIAPSSRVLVIHSGGIQGRRSLDPIGV